MNGAATAHDRYVPRNARPRVAHRRSRTNLRSWAAVAIATFILGACGSASVTGVGPSGVPATLQPSVTIPSPNHENCPTTPPPPLAAGQTRTVTITTAKGSIAIKVEASLGPRAAGNFVALASCGFYDHLVFHRLVPGFVIQGGDPTGTGTGGPGYSFPDDPVTVPYTRGVVAMANAGPNTNGSQFFIVLADAKLAPSYSVFGHVVSGMDTVDAIAAGQTTGDGQAVSPVAMDTVSVSNP